VREGWVVSWSYLGRFFVLGLIVYVPATLLLIAVLIWWDAINQNQGLPQHLPNWVVVVLLAYSFVLDIALTFVTPALAFTTRRVREAWMIGWSMLRRTWPKCSLYALFPPLTVLALASLNPTHIAWIAGVLLVTSTLVGLAVKGATASFYLNKNQPLFEADRMLGATAGRS
jgi:hypothetical protein